ncbi:MAG: nitroreductase family protein [Candidatus Bathyarchaeota archaeon]|nr:nitroreductase family protein [Candidatus Bathyarchaeota archaeon]
MSEGDMPSHHGVEVIPEGEYPNDTIRILFERGSCRSYSDRDVPEDVLRVILEAGTHAPTGGNLQPYSIIKVRDEETRRWFAEKAGQKFIGEAQVLLLFCIDHRRLERWADLEVAPFTAKSSFRHFWVSFQDTVMCAQNICTAADAMGMGSCYIGSVLEFFPEIRERFQLPGGVFPVVLLCLGYPEKKVPVRKKLGVGVVVHDEVYRELGDGELLEAYREKYSGPRDDRRVEITEERLDTIRGVCSKVHGERFAERCVERIRENGYISPVQRYFGLHYRADRMPEGNLEYLRLMEESGFGWFNEYSPTKE